MRTYARLLAIAATLAAMAGCAPRPAVPAAVVKDKVYTVAPDALKVQAGIVSGELTGMKVTERVEEGSGRVTEPAKLTGKLVLKNSSTDQTVRLVGARIVYIDALGKPIVLEDNRTAPTLRLSSSQYGSSEQRLDPGQDSSQDIDADFPVEALKAKRLRDIRVELSYIPAAYREETMNFRVSIGGQ